MTTRFTNNSNRKTHLTITACMLATLAFATTTFAGEVTSGASAGASRFGPGTASANAGYSGDGAGIVRTDTRSGSNFSIGRGVSVGIDSDGLSLSASNAIATRFGPAIATNFNLSIGRDGSVSSSRGVSVAQGGSSRTAYAGGSAGTTRGNSVATSTAGGHTNHGGSVRASTSSETTRIAARRATATHNIAPRRAIRLRR